MATLPRPPSRDETGTVRRFSGMKMPMELRGKRVLVVGLAQTGIALARFLARRGAHVVMNDGKAAADLGDRLAALREAAGDVELALGGHSEDVFTGVDLVVMSPGVPELPAMAAARAAGIEVIAEI